MESWDPAEILCRLLHFAVLFPFLSVNKLIQIFIKMLSENTAFLLSKDFISNTVLLMKKMLVILQLHIYNPLDFI